MTDTTYKGEGEYVPKSYRFERDMDFKENEKRYDTLQFSEGSNDHYVYESAEELLKHKEHLVDMIRNFFNTQKVRLDILGGYSKGENHTILQGRRRAGEDKADYRISHNWGGYISNFTTGFISSIPIDVMLDDSELSESDVEAQTEALNKVSEFNDIDNLNQELIFDTSRFGRAFELHYRAEVDGQYIDSIKLIDADEMFVIRDKTVERNIIAAVHVPIFNGDLEVTVYTDKQIISYDSTVPDNPDLSRREEKQHYYNDVPVVEWANNRFREGDWENEIGLFDAYDAAQSDTANYMSDLNDAALVIKGDLKNSDLTPRDAYLMAKANVFMLESGTTVDGRQTSVDADYIYKKYDVQGTEAYKKRILDDIYKLVNVPNIDDDKFGSQSGIAIQYKLIGLQQLRATKVNYYKKALKRRYQLIANVHKELNDVQFNPYKLTFRFHENLPQDIWEEVEKFIKAGGIISNVTLTELSSFTEYEKEKERIAREERDRREPFMTDAERSE